MNLQNLEDEIQKFVIDTKQKLEDLEITLTEKICYFPGKSSLPLIISLPYRLYPDVILVSYQNNPVKNLFDGFMEKYHYNMPDLDKALLWLEPNIEEIFRCKVETFKYIRYI